MVIAVHLRYQFTALIWSLVGTTAVMFSLVIINQLEELAKSEPKVSTTEFVVDKSVENKPKPKPESKPKPKPQATPPQVPQALLDTTLSGVDLGGYGSAGMGGVDESLLGDTSNVVMTSDMVDVAPTPKIRTPVEYPARAMSREIEGHVVLSLLIGKDGKVESVKVLEADPAGVFESAAEHTVKGWVFEPARYKGEPVKTWANQTIRFRLG